MSYILACNNFHHLPSLTPIKQKAPIQHLMNGRELTDGKAGLMSFRWVRDEINPVFEVYAAGQGDRTKRIQPKQAASRG
jgi:hypothetical protein